MANKTAIVQAALARLGAEVPNSIDEDSDELIAADAIYDSVVEEFLCKHAWTFATRWRSVARTVNTAPAPWLYEYELPSGALNLRELLDEESGVPVDYELAEALVYANAAGPLLAIHNWRASEERWPGDFSGAVEEELLGRLLGAFEERLRSIEVREIAASKLDRANTRDRRQRPPRRVAQAPLLRAWFGRQPRRV